MAVYKKRAKKAPARPRLTMGLTRPAPLLPSGVALVSAPAEPVGLDDDPLVGEELESESEPGVMVPTGTLLLLPLVPLPEAPPIIPPVGEADPLVTTGTRVVPLTPAGTSAGTSAGTPAGTPCEPDGMAVSMVAVLTRTGSGWLVTTSGMDVATSGIPVTTLLELVWEVKEVNGLVCGV